MLLYFLLYGGKKEKKFFFFFLEIVARRGAALARFGGIPATMNRTFKTFYIPSRNGKRKQEHCLCIPFQKNPVSIPKKGGWMRRREWWR